MLALFCLLFTSAFAFKIQGTEIHHAVLVAGSRGFSNYRHQADVCHAYQVLLKGGMDPNNIIVMSYDDVANSPSNPYPGKLFNAPPQPGADSIDVYEGCAIDYDGKDVTPKVFLNVIKGKWLANLGHGNGRVLRSKETDNVFLNFVDHGAEGIIAFPLEDELHATDLNAALQYMYEAKMYNKMVFYLEACNAGSMFDKILPATTNIYALTASNPKESSWGTYCPPQDKASYEGKTKRMGSCLGDLFSVVWMQETDLERDSEQKLTLQEQSDFVTKHTNKSHVTEYGDLDFMTDYIDEYEGSLQRNSSQPWINPTGNVDSRDIRLHLLYYKMLRAPAGSEERASASVELQTEIDMRNHYDEMFHKFSLTLGFHATAEYEQSKNTECYKKAIQTFKKVCNVDPEFDYVMTYYKYLRQACEQESFEDVSSLISSLC